MTALLGFGRSVADQGLTRLLTGDPARAGIHVSGALAGPGGRTQDQAVRIGRRPRARRGPDHVCDGRAVPAVPPAVQRGRAGRVTVFWAVEDLREHPT